MSAAILKHLNILLALSEADVHEISAGEWTQSLGDKIEAQIITEGDAWKDQDPWNESVLHLYISDADTSLERPEVSMWSDLTKKFNLDHIAQSLLVVLSSRRTNDEISGEMAELLGFNELDLIMKLLSQRGAISAELRQLLKNQHSDGLAEYQQPEHVGRMFSPQNVRQRMENQFKAAAARPLFTSLAESAPEILPHVYSSSTMAQGNVVSQFGSKYMLPIGTDRNTYEEYEEVIIPPAKPLPPMLTERLIPVSELDELVKGSFSGYVSLNRIQSIVYPTAYGSNENILICAPTGAGKTDVAMLTVLRVIDQHRFGSMHTFNPSHIRQTIDKDAFKIIYVAPMKALASEIVRKLGKRLHWLSIEVRELTGDMQLTKTEIARTQIIVTTPEKWDVVTRKPTGEGELASKIKLLIIDEVHLLNEERGAVIETIVARTLRQVESNQSMIRIVGLSATLPNYRDVAEFLCASRQKGLFYFDSSFRPVPLEQHFLGIKGKPKSTQSRKNLDHVTFQKVSQLVAEGHQVMVFVHARKETVKSAMALRETSILEGNSEHFSCEDHPQYNLFRQKIGESRNKEMKLLFDGGFGIHHAGMLRSDRNLMERMFAEKAIKVLCCTATLAWGVNLPAHAVIIKGTQVYDSAKGNFVDLSVLDVLQIFGRAGRPGMETSGEGYICTTEDKLEHYLNAVTSSIPIESQFQTGMIDSLNAEIALGTVSTVRDAVQWLGYTYLFVRMRINPIVYGIPRESILDDPQLGGKRNELIALASKKLKAAKMITYDAERGQLQITDLGRIAAKYYIRHASIEIFNDEFRPKMSEADVLSMLSKSTEFDQIQVRESEMKELEEIMERIPCQVKGGADSSAGKVNILLQGFISREVVDDFALVSDMAYAAQNGGRIVRALLEIAMSKKWAHVTAVLMGISKAIETRMWPYDHPLRQFHLKPEALYALEKWADEITVSHLAVFEAVALGKLVHLNELHGQAIINAAKQFPTVSVSFNLQPITSDVLKISLEVTRAFEWNVRLHGTSEPFWLWVEDQHGLNILQLAHILFHQNTNVLKLNFFILVPNGETPQFVTVKALSDRWVGAEDVVTIPLDTVTMPKFLQPHTRVLQLPFLTVTSIGGPPQFKEIFSKAIHTLNSLQTQSFWNMVYAEHNSLLCAPAGSGKSILAQMTVWMKILKRADGWILIVTPNKTAALETMIELRHGSRLTGIDIQYGGDKHQLLSSPPLRAIRVLTSRQLLDAFSTRIPNIRNLHVVVCEGLEQLDSTYELGISLLRLATQSSPTRFVAISASLDDTFDLAKWLDVHHSGITTFTPNDRDQSLITAKQTFSIPYSASLFKSMARPAHRAIQSAPRGSQALVFVPSRGQCRPIAQDLITQCTLEIETARGYIPEEISEETLGDYAARFRDSNLLDIITKGVGFFHSGIGKEDRILILAMFAEGIIRVLIVPKDACWSVPVRASVVIVMGTQYSHVEEQGASRQIKEYSLTELVRMQSRAVQQSDDGRFYLFCQAEALETYSRFLEDGLPLESQLPESRTLRDWARSFFPGEVDKQHVMDILSFTFLAQRVVSNPSFYGFMSNSREEDLSSLVDQLVDSIWEFRRQQQAPT